MQQMICIKCGAEMPSDARFCRRCGQQQSPAEPGTVTDATTRLLETPERPRIDFSTPEGGPLMPSGQTQSIEGMSTKALESPKPQQKWMITSMVLVVLLVIVTAVLLIKNSATSTTVVTPPTVTRPEIPLPPVPPIPPLPPGVGAGEVKFDPSLIYPGSQTTMTVIEGKEGTVTQLHSSDSMEKVADWYTNKLKPTKAVRMPGSTVLEVGPLKVIITSTGNGTEIILKDGDD